VVAVTATNQFTFRRRCKTEGVGAALR
jgi:hypothetical protein